MVADFLKLGSRITLLPLIHGSGDFAIEVRRVLLSESFDCLAVPLPPSFQHSVEQAIEHLPQITAVVQREQPGLMATDWTPTAESDDDNEPPSSATYVPIDPCQGVIAALRIATQERIARRFIDLESIRFPAVSAILPDAYAVKTTGAEKFAAALLPAIPRLTDSLATARVHHMARRLRELQTEHRNILCLCSLMDWPWLREAYIENTRSEVVEDSLPEPEIHQVNPKTLMFFLGEIPFISGLYERARAELEEDENLTVDGIKELLLASRDAYRRDLGQRGRRITPKLLRLYLKYVRNLSLIDRRLTPDLYTLVRAAQQLAGDQFAMHLAETAHRYPWTNSLPYETLDMSVQKARFPRGDVVTMINRLPGVSRSWRSCELQPRPPKIKQQEWKSRFSSYSQCSWPPEDVAIERFRTRVRDVANEVIGNDLARSEKFSSSLKDGLDMRETLRNWHTGELWVKVLPPNRGGLDCVVMLFDSPADPRDYPYRITWHAEHHDESTLSLFATRFHDNFVGPGIALATYGGAMFLFPPRPIVDVWRDPRFDFTDTLEERLIAAACHHSSERHVVVLSESPPGPGFRRLARKYKKKLVHVPLSRFSQETVQQLRMFHVLGGHRVRTYASHFIRKA